MKLISRLLNLLVWVFTFCLCTVSQWGVYNLIALPEKTSRIAIASTDDNVAYTDTFLWWGTDLSESLDLGNTGKGPRHTVTSWANWSWWQSGMRWADYAVEAVTGAVVPVFSPTYEVKQLSNFRLNDGENFAVYTVTSDSENLFNWDGKCLNDDVNVLNNTDIKVECVMKPVPAAYDGNYSFTDELQGYSANDVLVDTNNHAAFIKYSSFSSVAFRLDTLTDGKYSVYTNINGTNYKLINDSYYCNTDYNWKDACSVYNKCLWKVVKYNSSSYTKWVNKFKTGDLTDNDGNFIVKSSVSSLYFQFYLALIMSIWFVYQNPIVIERTPDGANNVKGGMHMRMKHRKNKNKDEVK